MNYLTENICTKENKIDLNKVSNININLIKNCPEYNYKNLLEIIKYGEGKNFITKIINILHSDLNLKFEKENSKEEKNLFNKVDSSEFKKFINDIKKSNKSIIFDLFFGIKKSKKICNKCNHEINKYKIFNVFNISMDSIVNKYHAKGINIQKTMKNEEGISIED